MNEGRPLILGTAGHIDHGKTALVRALTGVDTDRLPEEKARGITIDLGFAAFQGPEGLHLGVVDVPGHEDFVRTMVAGATGMDVVLLVVAADEGVMPQTREHLDILRVLDVPALVVALTKSDLVEPEWIELVEEEVASVLSGTRYADAPVIRTSATTGAGMDELTAALGSAASQVRLRDVEDIPRLPVDRVFTVQGTGTVVTGTLWSGALRVGDRVRVAPGGAEARIRSIQVHGRDSERAAAGQRTAVALVGVDRADVPRGSVLFRGNEWQDSWMLTARVALLHDTSWTLEHGQRLRVLLATSEVLARCAILEGKRLDPGESGWVQLRLEAPVAARAGDHVVLRSYSPVTTIGGAVVAEPSPSKRKRIAPRDRDVLARILDADPAERVEGALASRGWQGVDPMDLPVLTGRAPPEIAEALIRLGPAVLTARGRLFGADAAAEAEERMLAAVDQGHRDEPLSPVVPMARLRSAMPEWAHEALADAVVHRLEGQGRLTVTDGGARRPDFSVQISSDQREARDRLLSVYREAGLAAPFVDDLPEGLRVRPDLPALLRLLEREGELRTIDVDLFVSAATLDAAAAAVTAELGGKTGLGPADFRGVLPVSRRHLMPLLAYLDGRGVTVRLGPVRDVPAPT